MLKFILTSKSIPTYRAELEPCVWLACSVGIAVVAETLWARVLKIGKMNIPHQATQTLKPPPAFFSLTYCHSKFGLSSS